jgi:hypothetical protein
MDGHDHDALIAAILPLVTIVHVPEPETDDPADHFYYDDPDEEREQVAHVRRLAEASIWGWCVVRTTATYRGFHGSAYLGACSYGSREHFEADEGARQAHEACGALVDALREAARLGAHASEILAALHPLDADASKAAFDDVIDAATADASAVAWPDPNK